ncbi:hypothetical protein PBI_MEGABEAR_45 [Mycobacterium phage Megabear]|nr:hypothetical protein PBI_MEGABEAR_45 [Mycobacterium phage Megabear]
MIRDEGLRTYADVLEQAGFTVYETNSVTLNYFRYSRMVDGKECFGYVQLGHYGGYSHSMPIRPSTEHGSSMWVEGVPDSTPQQGNKLGNPLTVKAATKVASPTNWNPLVGEQENYDNPRFHHMYQRRNVKAQQKEGTK